MNAALVDDGRAFAEGLRNRSASSPVGIPLSEDAF